MIVTINYNPSGYATYTAIFTPDEAALIAAHWEPRPIDDMADPYIRVMVELGIFLRDLD